MQPALREQRVNLQSRAENAEQVAAVRRHRHVEDRVVQPQPRAGIGAERRVLRQDEDAVHVGQIGHAQFFGRRHHAGAVEAVEIAILQLHAADGGRAGREPGNHVAQLHVRRRGDAERILFFPHVEASHF